MEHPSIERAIRTGYPNQQRNISQNSPLQKKSKEKELTIAEFQKARFGK